MKEPYQGDLNKTGILTALFSVPKEQRDGEWKNNVIANISEASFACGNPQVIEGPDGFPYFQLNTPEPFKEFQCYVIKHMISDFLLKEGHGIVINVVKGAPDWVLSYGDIVNYHLRQEFYSASSGWNQPGDEVIKEDEEVLLGQPSESILPAPTRSVLRNFLATLGITDCKILLMNRTKDDAPLQELVFNLTPDKFQKKEYYEAVMKGIAWFLPRHYTYVAMHESSMASSFQPL